MFFCSPPVNPPKEISDIHDKKPGDWDERERYVGILSNIIEIIARHMLTAFNIY